MSNPTVSIIIPTYNRAHLLPRAVQSVLDQTFEDFEVVVVDDGSSEPIQLPEHPKVRVVRLPQNQGTAAARNAGARAARGRWMMYLDDDDRLLPHMLEVSLNGLMNTDLPKPVAVLSGLEVVNLGGQVTDTRYPPTLPRGCHFFLEEIDPGQSFLSKQTLVVERDLFLSIGGYDETFKSRVHTEMFLRLNPVCSILGLPVATYQLVDHEGPRISHNTALRQLSFRYLIEKHKAIFKAHPKMFSNFVYQHARTSYLQGQKRAAVANLIWALKIHPPLVLGKLGQLITHLLRPKHKAAPTALSSSH